MRSARRRLGLVAAVVALTVTAACGVPGHSKVIVDGQPVAPQPGGPGGPPARPAGAGTYTEATPLISAYLDAAAGSSVDAAATAVLPFMTSEAQQHWQRSTKITVVRVLRGPAPSTSTQPDSYTVEVEIIGLFDPATGSVDAPLPGPTHVNLTFVVHRDDPPSRQLRLAGLPNGLFMTEVTGLLRYYTPHTVYFWDAGRTRLIGERRYLPVGLSDGQQEAKIVNWILGGASPAMEAVVSRPPSGVTLRDPTIATIDDKIVINLSVGAPETDPGTLRQLVEQIGWSFGPSLLIHPIELQIDTQPQFVMDPFAADAQAFRSANVAVLRGSAVSFAIADGVVRPLANSYDPLVGVLKSDVNANVVVAAINSDQTFAAYVKPAPGGGQALWIVRDGAAPPTAPVLTGTSISFPAWVMGPTQSNPAGPPDLAVLVDGALMLVGGGGRSNQVLRPASATPLTSFAVSPEGSRVAMTIGGRLFTAVIVTQADRATLGALRQLNVDPATVDVVAWRSETELVVGGLDGDRIAEAAQVFADATNYDRIGPSFGSLTITQIAAYPSVALTPPVPINPILVQAGTSAVQIVSPVSTELTWSIDDTQDTPPTPTSSSSPGKQHTLAAPINPFFAE